MMIMPMKMRDELALRASWLAAYPGEFSRIEPAIGSSSGVPDGWAAYISHAGWVEFKAIDGKGMVKVEATQRLWLRRNLPHYRRIAYVIMDGEGFWTVPASRVHALLEERGGLTFSAREVAGKKVMWEALKASGGSISPLLVVLHRAWAEQ